MATRTGGSVKTASEGYQSLVRCFPLRPIRTESELDRAIAMVDALSDRADLAADERDYLIVLSSLIEKYEDDHYPAAVVSGVPMLRSLLEFKRKNPISSCSPDGHRGIHSVRDSRRQAKAGDQACLGPGEVFQGRARAVASELNTAPCPGSLWLCRGRWGAFETAAQSRSNSMLTTGTSLFINSSLGELDRPPCRYRRRRSRPGTSPALDDPGGKNHVRHEAVPLEIGRRLEDRCGRSAEHLARGCRIQQQRHRSNTFPLRRAGSAGGCRGRSRATVSDTHGRRARRRRGRSPTRRRRRADTRAGPSGSNPATSAPTSRGGRTASPRWDDGARHTPRRFARGTAPRPCFRGRKSPRAARSRKSVVEASAVAAPWRETAT